MLKIDLLLLHIAHNFFSNNLVFFIKIYPTVTKVIGIRAY